jgi:hypothetical protein
MDPGRLWMLLNDLAAKLGVEVRLESLGNDEDYQTHGGLIRLGGSLVAIIDRGLNPAARVEQLGRALIKTAELDNVYLMPAVREYLDSLGGMEE